MKRRKLTLGAAPLGLLIKTTSTRRVRVASRGHDGLRWPTRGDPVGK